MLGHLLDWGCVDRPSQASGLARCTEHLPLKQLSFLSTYRQPDMLRKNFVFPDAKINIVQATKPRLAHLKSSSFSQEIQLQSKFHLLFELHFCLFVLLRTSKVSQNYTSESTGAMSQAYLTAGIVVGEGKQNILDSSSSMFNKRSWICLFNVV